MPIIEVTLGAGRSPEMLRTLISRLTDAVQECGVAPRENVRVVIREVPTTHFAAGDVTLAERNASPDQPTDTPTAPTDSKDGAR